MSEKIIDQIMLALRKAALEKTEEIKSPIMRFLQIEEKLKAHLAKSGH